MHQMLNKLGFMVLARLWQDLLLEESGSFPFLCGWFALQISPHITKAELESQAKELTSNLSGSTRTLSWGIFFMVPFLKLSVIQIYITLKPNSFFYIIVSGLELANAFEKFLLLHALWWHFTEGQLALRTSPRCLWGKFILGITACLPTPRIRIRAEVLEQSCGRLRANL